MTTITIESIEAEQAKIAKMIADFKAQSASVEYHFPETSITLQPGEHYAGLIIGKDGEPSHHLVLLPGEAEGVNWKDAKAWAAEQSGELPTRREQALLYANLKEQFKAEWYWSAQEYESDPAYAWCQNFYDGNQIDLHKSNELRARAVRRLEIQ